MLLAFLVRDTNDWKDWRHRVEDLNSKCKGIIHISDQRPRRSKQPSSASIITPGGSSPSLLAAQDAEDCMEARDYDMEVMALSDGDMG